MRSSAGFSRVRVEAMSNPAGTTASPATGPRSPRILERVAALSRSAGPPAARPGRAHRVQLMECALGPDVLERKAQAVREDEPDFQLDLVPGPSIPAGFMLRETCHGEDQLPDGRQAEGELHGPSTIGPVR